MKNQYERKCMIDCIGVGKMDNVCTGKTTRLQRGSNVILNRSRCCARGLLAKSLASASRDGHDKNDTEQSQQDRRYFTLFHEASSRKIILYRLNARRLAVK